MVQKGSGVQPRGLRRVGRRIRRIEGGREGSVESLGGLGGVSRPTQKFGRPTRRSGWGR